MPYLWSVRWVNDPVIGEKNDEPVSIRGRNAKAKTTGEVKPEPLPELSSDRCNHWWVWVGVVECR